MARRSKLNEKEILQLIIQPDRILSEDNLEQADSFDDPDYEVNESEDSDDTIIIVKNLKNIITNASTNLNIECHRETDVDPEEENDLRNQEYQTKSQKHTFSWRQRKPAIAEIQRTGLFASTRRNTEPKVVFCPVYGSNYI